MKAICRIHFAVGNDGAAGILLLADFQHMNFTQMHERLRLELLRRIGRGSLSVSLLARLTGYGQSHISNFLRSRRQLSLEALDRVLSCQKITPWDLLPNNQQRSAADEETDVVPLVSHTSALFEPFIRPSSIHHNIPVPFGILKEVRWHCSNSRRRWTRFVAITVPGAEALPMDPVIYASSVVILDRHYNLLTPYWPDRSNLYGVRTGSRVALRYVDFHAARLILRPYNLAFPVNLLEVPPGDSPYDQIAGRVVTTINQH
jgi:transcriptional regulator with XRE-family HTH domain